MEAKKWVNELIGTKAELMTFIGNLEEIKNEFLTWVKTLDFVQAQELIEGKEFHPEMKEKKEYEGVKKETAHKMESKEGISNK
jgi:hypothetical protein